MFKSKEAALLVLEIEYNEKVVKQVKNTKIDYLNKMYGRNTALSNVIDCAEMYIAFSSSIVNLKRKGSMFLVQILLHVR